MSARDADTAKFGFEVKNLDTELRVASFRGSEGMSYLFQFELELVSEDPEIDFAKVVNQQAVITIEGQEEPRYVHGIVRRFEQGAQGNRFTHYHAWVVPKLWWLRNRLDCRIFQDKKIQEIIEEVLAGAGLTKDDYYISLEENHPKRTYCVQYRETDLAFIERLMEDEGVFYYFEHDDHKHTMVVGDSSSAYGEIPGDDTLPFVLTTGAVADMEHISRFVYTEGVSAGELVLRDFNFKKPGTNLEVSGEADQYGELSVYDYPGEYKDPERGKTLKEIRIQELVAGRKRASGTTASPRIAPGQHFALDKHPRDSFNQKYLITHVAHDGIEPQALEEEGGGASHYSNDFECIPLDVVYRPGRKTPKPLMEGPQTAIVVGPSNEEIYTDEFGRVKVQFFWDRLGKRDENSSCWVRVSQAWAGAGWGAMFLPRIGQEVIIDFLEGDPDHPVITGRLYDGMNRPPYPPNKEKTKSTIKSNSSKGGGGSNELRFEDKKGNEEIYLHAEKDFNETVKNSSSTSVGADCSITVGGSHTETIKKDANIKISDGNLSHDVVSGTATYHVMSDVTENYDATQSTTVKEDITIKSTGGAISVISNSADIKIDAARKITLHAGASKIEMDSSGKISIEGKDVAIKGLDSVSIKDAASSITLTPGSIVTSAPAITTTAGASHEIKGAIVKHNC